MPSSFPRLSFSRFGDPAQVLALQQTSMPSLRPGRRLLQMRYAPINPSDLIDSRPIRAPHRPAAGAWL